MTTFSNTPRILGLATSVPATRYSQQELFVQIRLLGLGSDPRTEAIFRNAGVGYRHAVVGGQYFAETRTTQVRNTCYLEQALPLGEDVIRRCLSTTGYTASDIHDFIVVSCTGIDTPGLDLQLAGRLGMRPDLRRTSVLGMGCYAAFPGLLRAREAVSAGSANRIALVLTLELCSLHLQMDDTLENMVSAALFADGASAVLIGTDGYQGTGPYLLDAATYCDYTTLDHMAFRLTDYGFQMRLSAYVPDLLAAEIEKFVDQLLEQNQLSREDIRFWGVHPGSGKILDHVQNRLGLSDADMCYSREVLHDYGNMSSATILFVLDRIHQDGKPQPDDYGVLMAFGPGLTMESMLVRW